MRILPQEVELWYVLPSIRSEFAKTLVTVYGFSQKRTAKLLGLTEAAVSQYLNSKRAQYLRFDNPVKETIKKLAARVADNKLEASVAILRICKLLKRRGVVCKVHKDKDPYVKEGCDICFK